MSKKPRKVKEIIDKLPREEIEPIKPAKVGKKVIKSTNAQIIACKQCGKTNLETGYIIKKAVTTYGLDLAGLCRICMVAAINKQRSG